MFGAYPMGLPACAALVEKPAWNARTAASITAQGCAINLTTGFLGGVNYTQAVAHPGVLLIGDVDGDGTVGDNDRLVLVDAIDGKRTATSVMDLNGDGVVVIARRINQDSVRLHSHIRTGAKIKLKGYRVGT